jgi:hypothetical protein
MNEQFNIILITMNTPVPTNSAQPVTAKWSSSTSRSSRELASPLITTAAVLTAQLFKLPSSSTIYRKFEIAKRKRRLDNTTEEDNGDDGNIGEVGSTLTASLNFYLSPTSTAKLRRNIRINIMVSGQDSINALAFKNAISLFKYREMIELKYFSLGN